MRIAITAGDALATAFGAVVVLALLGVQSNRGVAPTLALTGVTVVAALWAMRSQGLWIRRVCAIRVIEFARLTRACGIVTVALVLVDRVAHLSLRLLELAAVVITCWLLLLVWRSVVRLWISNQRRQGRYLRRIVVIGTDRRATELINVLDGDPAKASTVIGVIGPEPSAAQGCTTKLRLGDYSRVIESIDAADPDAVVISTTDLDHLVINDIVRKQHETGRTVMIDPGFGGINLRSVQVLPVAYEPLLHVEKVSLARPQLALKRGAETILAAIGIVILSPLLIAVALAIKVSDRGPVFFKQTRIGKDGKTFGVYKFRTMVVDAEARLAALKEQNQRRGPLFKMNDDPRVTRVGHFLRDSSLDELPQLFNVLLGQMSIVGPRPALPREVESFPDDLRCRQDVKPGITGLWQVEARDNPSFDVYRRLDLFYVRNWSLSLDMVIMFATFEQVIVRLVQLRRGKGDVAAAAESSNAAPAEL